MLSGRITFRGEKPKLHRGLSKEQNKIEIMAHTKRDREG
jgi:hypothetical protein